MTVTRNYWITGAGAGLGLALAQRLLEQGQRVAVSGSDSAALAALCQAHASQVLRLPGQLHDPLQAEAAGEQLRSRWGALDCLIINAGTCDYLAPGGDPRELFAQLIDSNHDATRHALHAALPALAAGQQPQVMAILSSYTAQQRFHPTQPATAQNSLAHWLREQRPRLLAKDVVLTLVAPQPMNSPPPLVVPEPWTAQSASQELLARLQTPQAELVLQVLEPNRLWPLPG